MVSGGYKAKRSTVEGAQRGGEACDRGQVERQVGVGIESQRDRLREALLRRVIVGIEVDVERRAVGRARQGPRARPHVDRDRGRHIGRDRVVPEQRLAPPEWTRLDVSQDAIARGGPPRGIAGRRMYRYCSAWGMRVPVAVPRRL